MSYEMCQAQNELEEFLTIGFTLNYRKFPVFTLTPLKEINPYIVSEFALTSTAFFEKVNQDVEHLKKVFELQETVRKIVGPNVMVVAETPVRVGVDKLITIIKSTNGKIELYADQHY